MSFLIADRVRESSTTTGTGSLTLAGAVSGFKSFGASIGNGNSTYYCIAHKTLNEWEVGIGTYTASGTLLSRDSVISSSNSNALVSFSAGDKDVFVTCPAERALTTDAIGSTIQENLVSSTNIKTVNGNSLLGSGDLTVGGGSSTLTIDNKTSAYTVVAGDLGKIINCTSGTFTVSLTASATLGAGFNCWIWNTGTGVITIDPNGTEAVDGVDPTTEFKLVQGTGIRIVCNGSGWLTTDSRLSGDSSLGILGTQLGRNSAGNMSVAKTGQGAISLGGSYSSGIDGFAAGVANNTSSYGSQGSNSIAIGSQAFASGARSVAIGGGSITNGTGSVAISAQNNFGCTASSSGAVAIGEGNIASSNSAHAFGKQSIAAQAGKYAYASGFIQANGDAQYGLSVLKASTTGTAVVLTSTLSAASTSNQLIVASNQVMAFTGTLIGKESGSANIAAYKIEGTLVNNAGTVTMPTGTLTAIGTDSIGLTSAPTLAADNTNKGLTVTSGEKTATNIRWVATIQSTELTYS